MNGEPENDDLDPLLGTIVDDDIPDLVGLPPPPRPMLEVVEDDEEVWELNVPPPRPKVYCESCGHVDSHADGCPRADALENLAALDAEEAAIEAARAAEPEPITPLIRRIGASLLRRFARFVEPPEKSG